MAKQSAGYMGGFSGRLGPAVGYMWNGVWCVRARQRYPRNPRTKAQVAQRDLFKAEVRLAASMRWAVTTALTESARAAHMTSYNLFVHLNQQAFSLVDGQLAVDWSRLRLSVGDVREVSFGQPQWTADGVLTVAFDKCGGANYDRVHLYVYCPSLGQGFLAAPVYRRTKSVSVLLPDEMAGQEVHVYGMVEGERGGWSPTAYAGALTLDEAAMDSSTDSPDGGVQQNEKEMVPEIPAAGTAPEPEATGVRGRPAAMS